MERALLEGVRESVLLKFLNAELYVAASKINIWFERSKTHKSFENFSD